MTPGPVSEFRKSARRIVGMAFRERSRVVKRGEENGLMKKAYDRHSPSPSDNAVAANAIMIDTISPAASLSKRSLPKLSVPIRCEEDGG